MSSTTLITDALVVLERAARNGTRAHLDNELVRAIIAHPAYARYVETRTQKMIDSWRGVVVNKPAEPSSETIGSITAPNETTGASAGTIPQLVHDAGAALAWAEASRRTHRKRRAKP